jgi:transmembrane sensor
MTGPSTPRRDALLDDPALKEALADFTSVGRLTDADVRAMRAQQRRHVVATGAATAALLLVVVGGAWKTLHPLAALPPAIAHFETRRGQQVDVALADGSTLRLDGASSVDVALAADHRDVTLRQGQAFFDVAHDPARPFTVHAGASDARVLGTAFDLNLTRGRTELAVYRGAVRFGGQAAEKGVVVKAGWRSRFSGGVARVPTPFNVAQEDWRQGWLDTEDMRLGDLVEALNRQGGPLVLPPPSALADMPIAGRFKLDDPARLLDAIGGAYGFRVEQDGSRLRLRAAS